jgi:hypothetical protein
MAQVNVKYIVKMMESERGWGQDYWDVAFDTRAEAEKYMNETNTRNTSLVAPDYYIKALSIEMVEA